MNIKYFVFTCVKNGELYINKLFQSLIEQKDTNFVHFIYDDGSNDDTLILIKEYIQNVNNLKYPYEVCYVSSKINKGNDFATQYCLQEMLKRNDITHFMWMNCDDWYEPSFFYEMNKAIKIKPNYNLFRAELFTVKNGFRSVLSYSKKENDNKDQLMSFLIHIFLYSHFVVDISFFKKINPNGIIFPYKTSGLWNDTQICYQLIFGGAKCYMIHKPLSNFLIRENSLTGEWKLNQPFKGQELFYLLKNLNFSNKKLKEHLTYKKHAMQIRKLQELISKRDFDLSYKLYKKIKKEIASSPLKRLYFIKNKYYFYRLIRLKIFKK